MVVLLVVLMLVMFLTIDFFVKRHRGAECAQSDPHEPRADTARGLLSRIGYRVPDGVFFHGGHTWLYLEESGVAKLGISDFARIVVGKIDRVVTRPVGDRVEEGDILMTLSHEGRSVKFLAPVDGVIEEVNTAIPEPGETLDINPMTANWFYRIRPVDTSALSQRLHIGRAAKEWLDREVDRLKVLLATVTPEHQVVGATQLDGGVPRWGLIDQLDDDEWQTLQGKFFG